MAKTLQELRKEAGYSSAKEFAKAIGMSESSYSRYEASPDNINMKAAIKLADFLHCSLDMVMGRDPIDIVDMRGDVQKFYESLSEENKKLLDEFSAFLLTREKQAEEARRNRRLLENLDHYKYYLRKYNTMLSDDQDAWKKTFYLSPQRKREAFEKFLRQAIDEEMVERLKGLEEAIEGERIMAKDELWLEYCHTHHTDVSCDREPAEEWLKERLEKHIEDYRNAEIEFMKEKNEEQIQAIMDAYDKSSSPDERGFQYGVITLDA